MHLYASIKFIYFVSDVYERGVVRKMHFNMIAVFFFFYISSIFQADKNAVKGRLVGAHFDLRTQNWERHQNKDFRSYVFNILLKSFL